MLMLMLMLASLKNIFEIGLRKCELIVQKSPLKKIILK